jgi:flagellar biosynthetic protein FliO
MQGRKRLALDMLVVTLCCALWILMSTSARDKALPGPADATGSGIAASTPGTVTSGRAPAAGEPGGELSLYLDKHTTAEQTVPDDPAAALRSGVTVSSSSAVQGPAGSAARSAPAPAADLNRVRSRQDSLSFGGPAEKLPAAPRPVEAKAVPAEQGDAETVLMRQQPAPPEQPVLLVQDEPVTMHPPAKAAPAKPGVPKAAPGKPVVPKPAAPKLALPKPAQPKPAAKLPAKAPGHAAAAAARPAPAHGHGMAALPAPAGKPAAAKPPVPKAPEAEGTSLRDHFSDSELAGGNDSVVLPPGEELLTPPETGAQPDAAESAEPDSPGVIATRPSPAGKSPTLGDALHGAGGLGAQVPTIAPWRYVAGGIFLLALLFLAYYLRQGNGRNPFKLLAQKTVNVIETINLAPGRQIVLVEMRGAALVLGVTPQSINLLDRLPLELLEGSYQPTVNQIITRESAARTADWAARPRFAAAGGGRPVAPSLVPPLRRSYGPPPQGRMSVAELRRARSTGDRPTGFGELRVTTRPASTADSRSKAELIDNLRRQLDQLER